MYWVFIIILLKLVVEVINGRDKVVEKLMRDKAVGELKEGEGFEAEG